MVVGYGVAVPKGHIAVYSTDTEEQARKLITASCPLSLDGEYYAEELAHDQTLENLAAFSDRLHEFAQRINLFDEGS